MERVTHKFIAASARLFLMGILAITTAQAFAVTLLSDDRYTLRESDAGDFLNTPDAPFADFSVIDQTSSVSPDSFSGNGRATAEVDFFFFIEESVFDITFSVSVATLIDLQGALSGEDGDFGLGFSEVALYAGSSTSDPLLFGTSGGSGNSVPFSFVDTLDVGVYRLVLNTVIIPADFGTLANWEFTADFTEVPVPIPAMGWLLGLSFLALFRRRRPV